MQNDSNNESSRESQTMGDDSPRNQDITSGHPESNTEVLYDRSNSSVGDRNENKSRNLALIGHAGDGRTPFAKYIGKKCVRWDVGTSTHKNIYEANIFGTRFRIEDTEGIGKAGSNERHVMNKNIRVLKSLNGIDCFVFVIAASTFTEGRRKTLSLYMEQLGAEFFKRTIFVFTGFDRRAIKSGSFEEFIKSADFFLLDVITKCNKRCIPWFSYLNNEGQRKKLFEMINDISKYGSLDTQTIQEMDIDEPSNTVSRIEFDQLKKKVDKIENFCDKVRVQQPST